MLALLSVYDKTGIAELGCGLVDLGYEVVSTGVARWPRWRQPVCR